MQEQLRKESLSGMADLIKELQEYDSEIQNKTKVTRRDLNSLLSKHKRMRKIRNAREEGEQTEEGILDKAFIKNKRSLDEDEDDIPPSRNQIETDHDEGGPYHK
ncbi:hypothetical protein DPMN_014733 [Dreissena polymorpha]|uniref:Uncharacterized protein n=1 Tax=Dreissena polymorpha TaxID=45954 RepID=A0A9D4N9X8_DREPO|nr:hypothetical protein DPMN_014733 [Dreissena polymorpha]